MSGEEIHLLTCLVSSFSFHRIALVLLTLHYFSEFFSHAFQLVEIFGNEKVGQREYLKEAGSNETFILIQFVSPHPVQFFNNVIFVLTRFSTMVLAVLSLFYGINTTPALVALFVVYAFQGHMSVQFIKEFFRKRRESAENKASKKKGYNKVEKKKQQPKPESDLPEADQNTNKIKAK